MFGIEEIQKTVYKDSAGREHLTRRDAQLYEIAYVIQRVGKEDRPLSSVLSELIKSIDIGHFPLIEELMGVTALQLRRESLPERVIETMNRNLNNYQGLMTIQVIDKIARDIEEEGYVLIKPRQ